MTITSKSYAVKYVYQSTWAQICLNIKTPDPKMKINNTKYTQREVGEVQRKLG